MVSGFENCFGTGPVRSEWNSQFFVGPVWPKINNITRVLVRSGFGPRILGYDQIFEQRHGLGPSKTDKNVRDELGPSMLNEICLKSWLNFGIGSFIRNDA